MDMAMPSGGDQQVQVIIGVQRRRRWTPQQKLQWVKRSMEPGCRLPCWLGKQGSPPASYSSGAKAT